MGHRSNSIVNVVVPALCDFDQTLHVLDAERCIDMVAREGCTLVVTLACGCPLIAVRYPSTDGLVA